MWDGTSNRAAKRLTRLARSQHGVFTRQQAHICGLTDDSLWRRTKSGLLVAESKNVLRFAVVPQSFKQMLVAQCLRAPGRIWVSHRAAGALWQLDEILPEVVEVTSLISIAPSRSDVVVHRVADMPSRDTCVLAGIPVTTVHRTLIDLGAVAGADVVEAAMESALRRRLTTIERLEARMEEIGGRGRRGAGGAEESSCQQGTGCSSYRQRARDAVRATAAKGKASSTVASTGGPGRIRARCPSGLRIPRSRHRD
jgi:hypothetical protein